MAINQTHTQKQSKISLKYLLLFLTTSKVTITQKKKKKKKEKTVHSTGLRTIEAQT